MIIKRIEDFIKTYVKACVKEYPKEAHNFELKYEHTLRVRQHSLSLAGQMNLNDDQTNISEIIALLHDIGRFKQYRNFQSFADAETGSHASMSVQMIKEFDLLQGMSEETQNLIRLAIEYHNHYELKGNLSKDLHMYSSLIRDADKLDAFYIHTQDADSRKYNLKSLSDKVPYSEEVISDLLEEHQVDFSNFKYKHDRQLGILGLIFNLEYKASLYLVKEADYIEKLLSKIEEDEKIKQVKETCHAYLNRKLRH